MQQGPKSGDAIRFCEENDISVVAGECVLMFAELVAFYRMIAGCEGYWGSCRSRDIIAIDGNNLITLFSEPDYCSATIIGGITAFG